MNQRCTYRSFLAAAWIVWLIGCWAGIGWAAFGDDIEKPQPKFVQEGSTVVATLLPRAKSTSVQIRFNADRDLPLGVIGIDFESIRTSDLDIKEFKSAFFQVDIEDVTPGGQVVLNITSDFFTSSTQYWVYRPDESVKWRDSGIAAKKAAQKLYTFAVPLLDGGPFDADGKADGKIRFVGGPKDGFWSYALGTLVIRFFGVFMVLSILMIGMIIAGRLFVHFEKSGASALPNVVQTPVKRPSPAPTSESVEEAAVAAIATAIHLSRGGRAEEEEAIAAAVAVALHLEATAGSTARGQTSIGRNEWVVVGRQLLQETRLQVFSRPVHSR
ncbi:MAG: OadG family transporter subunit [Thermodesulfobacteriota bacterium]